MIMNFKTGEIEEVIIEKLNRFSDERGYLVETFRIDKLPDKIRPAMIDKEILNLAFSQLLYMLKATR